MHFGRVSLCGSLILQPASQTEISVFKESRPVLDWPSIWIHPLGFSSVGFGRFDWVFGSLDSLSPGHSHTNDATLQLHP